MAAPSSIASVHTAHAGEHHHGHGAGHDHAAHGHDHSHGHDHQPLPPRVAAVPGLRVVSALTLSAKGRLLAAGAMAATLWLLALWAMT